MKSPLNKLTSVTLDDTELAEYAVLSVLALVHLTNFSHQFRYILHELRFRSHTLQLPKYCLALPTLRARIPTSRYQSPAERQLAYPILCMWWHWRWAGRRERRSRMWPTPELFGSA
jgi:hypothetical protein